MLEFVCFLQNFRAEHLLRKERGVIFDVGVLPWPWLATVVKMCILSLSFALQPAKSTGSSRSHETEKKFAKANK